MKDFTRKSLWLLGNFIDSVVTGRPYWIGKSSLTPVVSLDCFFLFFSLSGLLLLTSPVGAATVLCDPNLQTDTCKCTGCMEKGGTCFPTFSSGILKGCNCKDAAGNIIPGDDGGGSSSGGGGGTTDPPIGPPPSPLLFSSGMFEPGTFTFSKTINLTDVLVVSPVLVGFAGTVEFAQTPVPELFFADFTAYEFEYVPFDLPGTPFTMVNREILAPSNNEGPDGILDTSTGELSLWVHTLWITTDGTLAATSLEFFQVTIAPISPTLVDISFTMDDNFKVVPEPSTLLLLGSGLAGLAVRKKRWLLKERKGVRCTDESQVASEAQKVSGTVFLLFRSALRAKR